MKLNDPDILWRDMVLEIVLRAKQKARITTLIGVAKRHAAKIKKRERHN